MSGNKISDLMTDQLHIDNVFWYLEHDWHEHSKQVSKHGKMEQGEQHLSKVN